MSDETKKYSANKKFGQHFLNSEKIIQAICEDDQTSGRDLKYCLEIGPGPGILTKHLKEKERPFKVIEIDSRFIDDLKNLIGADNVVNQDALDINFEELFTENGWNESIWLVSNLPYNVAAPLMINFFPVLPIQRMTLMMQKEMADRIIPPNPKKSSNPLATYAKCFFDIKKLVHVPPGAFSPPPKVDSTVLSFERLDQSIIQIEDYQSLLKFGRGIFSTPRKQLLKVAKTNLAGTDWPKILEACDIPPTIRAEALSFEQVTQLFFAWKQGIN